MPIPPNGHNAHAWYYTLKGIKSGLTNRNIQIGEKRTSVRLDSYLWDSVRDLCDRENMLPNDLYAKIAADIPKGLTFSRALARYVLRYYRQKAAHCKQRD